MPPPWDPAELFAMMLFCNVGVPAANKVTPPPLEGQEFPAIVLFTKSAAEAPTIATPPPPTPPLQPGIWPLFAIVLPRMTGELKLLDIPPPPSPAMLLVTIFPVTVGDEFSIRIPPPRRAGETAALPFRNVKPLSTDCGPSPELNVTTGPA